MLSIPVRGPPQTQNGNRPNVHLLTKPSNDPAQESDIPSHDPSPSPPHSNHHCHSDNASSTRSLPFPHLSASLEVLEVPFNDHMDWTAPSITLPTPETSDTSASSSDSDTPLPYEHTIKLSDLLPLPTSSPGSLTHAHQQAMAHRITYDKLLPGGAFDPSLYTPVFLHDTLMLPGSLATLLGKDSPLDILDRLTPALLPSFSLQYHRDSPYTPRLLPSPNPTSSATGLLLLGTGRDARKAIREHYRPVAKRKLQNVAIEVKTPIPADQRKSANEQWRLEARWVEAQVFVWRGGKEEEGGMVGWELGEAISGAYEIDDGEMDVVSCWGGEESVVGSSESEGEWEVGDLRLDGKSEWAGDVVWGWKGDGRDFDVRGVEW